VPHPTIEGAGASPDGLVGDDGLVEIKCPNSAGMIEALLTQTVPGKYNTQMQMQMACTGRQWCDYVVFDPRMPQKAQLFIHRVERDDNWIDETEKEVVKFLAEVDAKVAALKKIIGEYFMSKIVKEITCIVGTYTNHSVISIWHSSCKINRVISYSIISNRTYIKTTTNCLSSTIVIHPCLTNTSHSVLSG
jgi:hypothetical protein